MMKIRCFGASGSIPASSHLGWMKDDGSRSPAFDRHLFGGNTTCYFVEAGPFMIILDNGSGAAVLGQYLLQNGLGVGKHFIVLKTHYHWDHIQGLPFCVPYFIASNTFHFHGHEPPGEANVQSLTSTVERLLSDQQDAPHFPVDHKAMPSKRIYHAHPMLFSETFGYAADPEDGGLIYCNHKVNATHLTPDVISITTIPLNHPNGCLGYMIRYMGNSFLFCTDNEPLRYPNAQIIKYGSNADLAVFDGQYTEQQVAKMAQAFGHGTPMSCYEQAVAAQTKHLVIHHHDPLHDDNKLLQMEHEIVEYASQQETAIDLKVEFAREGAMWVLGA